MQFEEVFRPLYGKLTWSVKCAIGSIVYMEFGEPHIRVREPIVAPPGSFPEVKRRLSRRQVFLEGGWTFSLLDANWELQTAHQTLDCNEPDEDKYTQALQDLDGQRLLAVENGELHNSMVMIFDLGGRLHVWPSGPEVTSDQWCLFKWGSDRVHCMEDAVREQSIHTPV